MTTREGLAVIVGTAVVAWVVLVTALGAWGTSTADFLIMGAGLVTVGSGVLALAFTTDER